MKKLLLSLFLFTSVTVSAQWTEQVSGVGLTLWSVSAVDDFNAWICGDEGLVLRTTNSGVNWDATVSPNEFANFYTIEGIDGNTALVGGASANATHVYKTTDGGVTWTETFNQTGGFVDAIKAYKMSPGNYVLIGDPVDGRWTWFVSTDYGSTWDSTGRYIAAASGEAGWNNSCFNNKPTSWSLFGTNNTKMIRANTDGTSSDVPTTGSVNIYSVWALDDNRIMAGSDGRVIYSSDGGSSFSTVNTVFGEVGGIVGGGASTWYHVANNTVYLSTDDGANWVTDYMAGSGTYYHISISPRGRYLWCVRNNGGISRYCFDIPLPVELASFTSVINKRDVTLNWTTVSEIDNAGFELERSSANNGTWSKIAFINGNGNTTQTSEYSYTDRGLSTGAYKYRLRQVDYNGNYKYHYLGNEVNIGVPVEFSLSQNFPNPFNPSTKINFDLPAEGNVQLKIYDMTGKEVASLLNERFEAGYHSVIFNASSLPSGVYIYRLSSGSLTETKKMTLVK